MTDEANTFVPVDLSPELQRESELKDLLWMRENDPTPREEVKNIIVELNTRLMQYNKNYSIEFRILQTVQDHQHLIVPLQKFTKGQLMVDRLSKAKVDIKKPVAMERGTNKVIIIAPGNIFTYKE